MQVKRQTVNDNSDPAKIRFAPRAGNGIRLSANGSVATRLDSRDTLVITAHPLPMLYEGWFFDIDVTGLATGSKSEDILRFGIGPLRSIF